MSNIFQFAVNKAAATEHPLIAPNDADTGFKVAIRTLSHPRVQAALVYAQRKKGNEAAKPEDMSLDDIQAMIEGNTGGNVDFAVAALESWDIKGADGKRIPHDADSVRALLTMDDGAFDWIANFIVMKCLEQKCSFRDAAAGVQPVGKAGRVGKRGS